MKKVMFISSTGGHLSELLQLQKLFAEYDYYLINEDAPTSRSLYDKFPNKVFLLKYGTKHHFWKYLYIFPMNCIKSICLFHKIKPDVIVTTGAHTAVPMCYIAKMFRKKVIFIETFANIHTKTLSGRLVYPIADEFIVQWESMLKLYPKAKYLGWIF